MNALILITLSRLIVGACLNLGDRPTADLTPYRQTATAPPAVRLKPGDVVSVYVTSETKDNPYAGDYTILSDGSIYGAGFGRLNLQGRTYDEGQSLLRERLKRFLRPDDVFLALKKQRPDYAYVIGSNSPGPVALPADPITVRQILPPLTDRQDGQRLSIEVVRAGKTVARTEYIKLLRDDDAVGNMRVEPNDLISVVPEATIRVWVLGAVHSPGQLALPVGSDLYQALASAGGLARLDIDSRLSVRHGPEVREYSPHANPADTMPVLSDGDVVTAMAPETVRVTVAGEVEKPGEYAILDNSSLLTALASASGALSAGNLAGVMVYRNGDLLTYDLSGKGASQIGLTEKVRAGDTIIVPEKTQAFFVFGEVRNQGRFPMDEHKLYRASDALAVAGGLSDHGALRRVSLMHPTQNGRGIIETFNLDEYLKDGAAGSNPEIEPGDVLMFGSPRGLTLNAIGQLISAAVIFSALAPNK